MLANVPKSSESKVGPDGHGQSVVHAMMRACVRVRLRVQARAVCVSLGIFGLWFTISTLCLPSETYEAGYIFLFLVSVYKVPC